MNDYNFEDLRQQMETLKRKLEHQEIVNERMVRQSIRRNGQFIMRWYAISIACGLLSIPYCYFVFVRFMEFSLLFWMATCLLMLVCVGAMLYNGRNLVAPDIMKSNLIDARKKIIRAKKFDNRWLIFGMPMLALWFAALIYEGYRTGGEDKMIALSVSAGIGLIVGLTIGLTQHFRTQRRYKEMVEQIEDLLE